VQHAVPTFVLGDLEFNRFRIRSVSWVLADWVTKCDGDMCLLLDPYEDETM
jgi:hypothetical protein